MPVLISAGVGLAGSIGKMIGRGAANRQMKKLLAEQPKYKYDEMARTLLNARMPGAAQAERNIYQTGANALGRMQQAATSSADLMQAAAGVQAQGNQAFQGLAGQEAQDYQRRYANYQDEQQRKFADELRQYQTKSQLQGAIQENKQNTWGDIANLGFSVANFASAGGFKGIGNGNKPPVGTTTQKDASYAPGAYSEGSTPYFAQYRATGMNQYPSQYNESYNPNSPNYNPLFSSPNPYLSMMNNMQGYVPMYNQNMGYNFGMKR